MIVRNSYAELNSHLKKKQVTVITGLRRVGKTTAVKYLLSLVNHTNFLYIDLEKVENRFLFNNKNYNDIESGLRALGLDLSSPSVLAIDEVQLVLHLPSVVKYLYDNYPIKFILTGSSSYYLKNYFTESLAGRKRIFELFPLDFAEYLAFKEYKPIQFEDLSCKPFNPTAYNLFKQNYEEFIKFGGFPEVVQTDSPDDKLAYLRDIVNSYIELDIKLLADFSVSDELYRLCQLLASHTGSRLDATKLGSILGVNRNKMTDYLNLFEHTYFIHRIPAFSHNKDREISLQRKVYLADTGFLQVLGNVSSGQAFENAVAVQLLRLGKVNYYQRRSGQEIDFILNSEIAVEVKETPSQFDLNTLVHRAQSIELSKSWLVGRFAPSSDLTKWYWGGALYSIKGN